MRSLAVLATLISAAALCAHAAPPKACDLLTPANAQTVLGGKVSPGDPHAAGPFNKCDFSDPNQSSQLEVAYVPLTYFDQIAGGSGGQAMARSQMNCTSTPDRKCELVPGIGETANYTIQSTDYAVTTIYHGYMISLTLSATTAQPNVKAPLLQLIKLVLTKF